MDKYLRLAEKLKNREKVIGTTMIIFKSPIILECMNREELDFVLFDAEHGVFDTQNVVELLQICRLMKLPAFVRARIVNITLLRRQLIWGLMV